MKLEKLIKELLKEGLYGCEFGYDSNTDSLYYRINGFAKSGYGTFKQDKDENIHLETRYGQDDIVESVKDVLDVAYEWDKSYCSKDDDFYTTYEVQDNWKELYNKYGYDISNFR